MATCLPDAVAAKPKQWNRKGVAAYFVAGANICRRSRHILSLEHVTGTILSPAPIYADVDGTYCWQSSTTTMTMLIIS